VETAVRIKHIPSGLKAASQSERSKNHIKTLAMHELAAKLHQMEANKRSA
jgi:peptide chain release factor 2